MEYFFSIVIPTYNRSRILRGTLDAILLQTYNAFEIIIVDDGGADDTKQVVEAYNDSRIKYFWKTNGERGAARNFGTLKTKGDYIFYLDSDDLVKPGYLAYANELVNINQQPAALHIPYNILLNGIEIFNKRPPHSITKKIFIQNQFACQVIVRRDVALTAFFSEDRNFLIGEDWYYIIKIALVSDFIIGEKRLGLIVQHTERSMHTVEYEKVLGSKNIFVKLLKGERNMPVYIIKNVDYELTNLAALQAVLHKKKSVALKLMACSFLIRPLRTFRKRNFAILKKILFN